MHEQATPRNRLHDIAQRKLGSLGIPTRPGADGGSLEGELSPRTPLRNPLSGKTIDRVRFVVEGHDKLRPIAPAAVEGLPAIGFIDASGVDALATQLGQALQRRVQAVQGTALPAMRRLRLEPSVDPEKLRAVGRLELTGLGMVVIEGDERGIRATWVEPMGGRPAVQLHEAPLVPEEFDHRVDLELHLYGSVEKAVTSAPASTSAIPSQQREASRGPAGPTLRELVEKHGPDARVVGSFTIEAGGPAKAAPSLQFSLGPAGAAPIQAGGAFLGGQILPVNGEIWVMSILVESDNGAEIRYVPVDIDGKAFGSPRTLAKHDFLATFESAGSVGYRLAAKVLEVSATHVTYVQLDPRRQVVGQPKAGTLTMFVHHFVPEAAAY